MKDLRERIRLFVWQIPLVCITLVIQSCVQKTDIIQTTCQVIQPPKSILSAEIELREGHTTDVWGTSVAIYNFSESKYLLPGGDTCFGLTVVIPTDEGDVRAGAGSNLTICGTRWFVSGLSSGAQDKDNGRALLSLIPDTTFPTSVLSDSMYSELLILPGGIRNSGFTLDGELIIVVEMDHSLSGNKDSASVHLNELYLIVGDAKYPARKFQVGSIIKTKQFVWTLVDVYFERKGDFNFTRVLLGRK